MHSLMASFISSIQHYEQGKQNYFFFAEFLCSFVPRIKTRHNNVHSSIFSDIMTELTYFFGHLRQSV